MEELVNKLAELQISRKTIEDIANDDADVAGIMQGIAALETRIAEARKNLVFMRAGFDAKISECDGEIERVSTQILDAWDGEKKTMVFDAGTLKFRTSQSLKITDPTLTLVGLLQHTSDEDVATKYIKGFNLTAVKKYMGVLSLPTGAAQIDRKTTVKLEQI